MEYTVNIPTGGTYMVSFRVASLDQKINFAFMRGNTTLADIRFDSTRNFQHWRTVSNTIELGAGTQTLRIQANARQWNINWFELELLSGEMDPPGSAIDTDLSVSMQGDSGQWEENGTGGRLAYIVTVSNVSSTDAGNVELENTFPDGVSLVSITPSAGSCSSDGLVCNLGDVGPFSHATVRIVLSQPSPEAKTYLASVSTTTDESSLNNNQTSADFGGNCFIATAAFGSYSHEYLFILRSFRDNILMSFDWGRQFVDLYYSSSPPLADWVAKHDIAKATTQLLLLPLIAIAWLLQTGWFFSAVLAALLIAGIVIVFRRYTMAKAL